MSHHRSSPDAVDTRSRGPAGPGSFRSPAAFARLVLTAFLGLGFDLITKVWAFRELMYNRVSLPDGSVQVQSHTNEFLPGWLHFHVTANQGAVFGIGQGNRWLFVLVSMLAIGFLVYLFATSSPTQRVYQVIIGMLMAGVLGNLYDRLFFGYVRDMIYMLPGRTWPRWIGNALPASWEWTKGPIFPWIFNVADALLCTGVALMLAYSLLMSRKAPHERQAGLEPVES
jgi:signal peptidase II